MEQQTQIVALSLWENRLAPLFDSSSELEVVEWSGGAVRLSKRENLSAFHQLEWGATLRLWGVELLLCGAISRQLELSLAAHGVEVCPFLSGSRDEVLAAFGSGTLGEERFAMPGCRGRLAGGERRGCRWNSGQTKAVTGCICRVCGEKLPRLQGVPCATRRCPKCGTFSVRREFLSDSNQEASDAKR